MEIVKSFFQTCGDYLNSSGIPLPWPRFKIAVIGGKKTGKKTILKQLSGEYDVSSEGYEDIELTTQYFRVDETYFVAHIFGDALPTKTAWSKVFPELDAIMYVIDSSRSEDFENVKQNLNVILGMNDVQNVPILLFGNKMDLCEEATPKSFSEKLGVNILLNSQTALKNTRKIELFMCNAKQKQGLFEGFVWLKRTKVAKEKIK